MAEGFGHLAIQSILAFGIYGALVVSYTLLGAWKNINIWQMRWDWKVWVGGLAKYLLLGVATLTTLLCSYLTLSLTPQWGVELAGAQQVGTKVIFGIIAAGIAAMLLKNIQKMAQILGLPPETVTKIQETALKTEPDKPLVLDVGDLPEGHSVLDELLDDDAARRVVQELVGGQGVYVTTDSPDAFRNVVIGRGFDIDGNYGWQCWDGFALFTVSAYGKMPPTGNGAARGCWELKRDYIASFGMDLITERNAIQKGDWVVLGGSQWGHVFMAMSGNLGGYVRALGQNQGGTPTNPQGGSAFNEVNMSLNNFLGAFRPRKWHVAQSQPTPQPAPEAQPAKKTNEQVAAEVMRGDWGNGEERKRRLAEAGYDYASVQAIVNEKLGAPKVGVDVVPAPAAAPGDIVRTFKVGDTVVPTKLVDWEGRKLRQYDPYYTISELKGKRAVLMARGQVWAAVSTDNLRHA